MHWLFYVYSPVSYLFLFILFLFFKTVFGGVQSAQNRSEVTEMDSS